MGIGLFNLSIFAYEYGAVLLLLEFDCMRCSCLCQFKLWLNCGICFSRIKIYQQQIAIDDIVGVIEKVLHDCIRVNPCEQ